MSYKIQQRARKIIFFFLLTFGYLPLATAQTDCTPILQLPTAINKPENYTA
ncbi:hypothetical protein [Legionella clemsonensis]|uniref:Uncharacterized protein n=1 Tax=Legionella clemsonensis TaxID=1867846 RepID=A0A222P3P9_9GAMM|nr:hypothetical protein [Legionella clemsonensis]ASQ46447.1 hypothetical protein clem_09485 [Legionella clemsonensis]